MDFHTADTDEILSGRVTDVYFERTETTLRALGLDRRVRAELVVKRMPGDMPWAVLLGVDDVVGLAEAAKLPITIRALPDGTLFRAGEPVLEIEGRYLDFGRFETAILGLLSHASGVATRAARVRVAAEGRPVVCFGARRVHPVLAPAVERYAWIGGVEGVAAVLSAERLGIAPSGTMPHALILLVGDTVEAARAFDGAVPRDVPRLVLVDTFQDEKFEALRVARALGPALAGVRLDTPSSRRGDFLKLLEEVRWELDLHGFRDVQLLASGGIGVEDIRKLNSVVDAYGVGTYITAAPPLDMAMDLVEIDGSPAGKRGKLSGSKSLWGCSTCPQRRVTPREHRPDPCESGGVWEDLLGPVLREGQRVAPCAEAAEVRERVLGQLRSGEFPLELAETRP
jgi:nicotinate phosphoribosyltransferase